jgi:hypothetical protein
MEPEVTWASAEDKLAKEKIAASKHVYPQCVICFSFGTPGHTPVVTRSYSIPAFFAKQFEPLTHRRQAEKPDCWRGAVKE